jgi:hypothetical protein
MNFWPSANKGYNFSAMESENCSSFRGILIEILNSLPDYNLA